MAHIIKLVKGAGYYGAVSVTKENPIITVDDETYASLMETGYFVELASLPDESGSGSGAGSGAGQGGDEPAEAEDGFGDMSVAELKAYAQLNNISLGSATRKADILAAVRGGYPKGYARRIML